MLDDVESRPGSATSLLRTFVGLHLRGLGGWIAVADLLTLLGEAGLEGASVRGTITRVKAKGLLASERRGGEPGYRLGAGAEAMLARGDRRIFAYRQQGDYEGWCLVSYSVPEAQRSIRQRLRRHLSALGCGFVADGLAVAPEHLAGEIEEMLTFLGLRAHARLFTGARLMPGGGEPSDWWDLPGIAARHEAFLAAHESPFGQEGEEAAFVAHLRLVDDWRRIPELDPGLHGTMLPADWPGERSVAVFQARMNAWQEPARAHVRALAAKDGGASPTRASMGE